LAGARVGEAGQVGHADVVLHLLSLLLCLKSIFFRNSSVKCDTVTGKYTKLSV
jgi:hypothetical protein